MDKCFENLIVRLHFFFKNVFNTHVKFVSIEYNLVLDP